MLTANFNPSKQICFNSQPPTKGTAIMPDVKIPEAHEVSILSPQQRGLQSMMAIYIMILTKFQFSAPNKGDCN